MLQQNEVLDILRQSKPHYMKEGLILLGLFGSFAKETQHDFSDIDYD